MNSLFMLATLCTENVDLKQKVSHKQRTARAGP